MGLEVDWASGRVGTHRLWSDQWALDSRIVRRANEGGKLIGKREQESVTAITFQLMDSQAMSDIW